MTRLWRSCLAMALLLWGCNEADQLPQPIDPDCGLGWSEIDAGCLDVDECSEGLDDCAEAAVCTNTDGGFECICLDGFEGDGKTCDDIDECGLRLDNCADDAHCENTPGGFDCRCDVRLPTFSSAFLMAPIRLMSILTLA